MFGKHLRVLIKYRDQFFFPPEPTISKDPPGGRKRKQVNIQKTGGIPCTMTLDERCED
jgi:hypothetical protein